MPCFAWACDPCALYHASRLQDRESGSGYLAIDHQFTEYDPTDNGERYSQKNGDQVEVFATTQFSVGYDLSDRAGLQVTLPLIYRESETFNNYRSSSDSDTELGDMILSTNYSLININSPQGLSFILGGSLGLKLPTGDSGTLESYEDSSTAESKFNYADSDFKPRHHPVSSASGGRVLTFGSGSYDYLTGLSFYSRYQRWLMMGAIQYTFRTEGDYNYKFADDLLFDFGPGYYFSLQDDFTAAARIVLTGEFKKQDHSNDELVKGSGYSNLFLGPEVVFTFLNSMFRAGIDFRVTSDEADADVMPDTRFRSGLTWRF